MAIPAATPLSGGLSGGRARRVSLSSPMDWTPEASTRTRQDRDSSSSPRNPCLTPNASAKRSSSSAFDDDDGTDYSPDFRQNWPAFFAGDASHPAFYVSGSTVDAMDIDQGDARVVTSPLSQRRSPRSSFQSLGRSNGLAVSRPFVSTSTPRRRAVPKSRVGPTSIRKSALAPSRPNSTLSVPGPHLDWRNVPRITPTGVHLNSTQLASQQPSTVLGIGRNATLEFGVDSNQSSLRRPSLNALGAKLGNGGGVSGREPVSAFFTRADDTAKGMSQEAMDAPRSNGGRAANPPRFLPWAETFQSRPSLRVRFADDPLESAFQNTSSLFLNSAFAEEQRATRTIPHGVPRKGILRNSTASLGSNTPATQSFHTSSNSLRADTPASQTFHTSSNSLRADTPASQTFHTSSNSLRADTPASQTFHNSSNSLRANTPASQTFHTSSNSLRANTSASQTFHNSAYQEHSNNSLELRASSSITVPGEWPENARERPILRNRNQIIYVHENAPPTTITRIAQTTQRFKRRCVDISHRVNTQTQTSMHAIARAVRFVQRVGSRVTGSLRTKAAAAFTHFTRRPHPPRRDVPDTIIPQEVTSQVIDQSPVQPEVAAVPSPAEEEANAREATRQRRMEELLEVLRNPRPAIEAVGEVKVAEERQAEEKEEAEEAKTKADEVVPVPGIFEEIRAIEPERRIDEGTATLPRRVKLPPVLSSPEVAARRETRLQKKRAAEQAAAKKREEEVRRRTLLPLTPEQDAAVEDVLMKGFGKFSRSDLNRVVPSGRGGGTEGWLNDEVINEYLTLIAKHGNSGSEARKYHAFSSYFYTNITQKGYSSVARWAKRAKLDAKAIAAMEAIYAPVNSGSHWTLLVMRPAAKSVHYYDSLGGSGRNAINAAKQWLAGELGSQYNEEEWSFEATSESPQQDNYSDCGVFAITTAKMLTIGVSPMVYGPADIPGVRRKIVAELMEGGLI